MPRAPRHDHDAGGDPALLGAKAAVREQVWTAMSVHGVARFPRPHGRIPNFVGAEAAAERLRDTDEWRGAHTIKANPDSPQWPVRQRALEDGKLVYMAVPRLAEEQPFLLLDPGQLDDTSPRDASSIKGATRVATPVAVDDLEPVDLVIAGCVAVGVDGARLGKGGGFSDLELAVAAASGLVDDHTIVATTVHEMQVRDAGTIPTTTHDVHVSDGCVRRRGSVRPWRAARSRSGPARARNLTPVSASTTGEQQRRVRSAPAPGEAPMPAADAAALLRENASDPDRRDRPALHFGDRTWTHAEYVAECQRFANLLLDRGPGSPERGVHVGVLLDNTPEYLFALGGAALAGAAVVGLNQTRRDEHLLRDVQHTHCDVVISEPRHVPLLEPIADGLPELLLSNRYPDETDPDVAIGDDLDDALAAAGTHDAGIEPGPDTLWGLIFTSGTSDAPKAVICTQRRFLVTGNRMGIIMGLGPDDVGYICMPLFHSNALMVGWAPSIVYGASVGLARKFSASRWLADIRRYGSTYFNYTGKPLAYILSTPEQPDDADNPLRVAFGNEGSPEVVDRFAKRFDVEVIDAYGATEGGVAVNRDAEQRAGALGQAGENVKVVDEAGNELPRARFDGEGRLVNADECVGEIVNTAGAGPFEGYYNNAEANEKTLRFGWYWTGDLGYLDDDRYLYFAGRNADWLRVDGENFPAQPIEATISQHPDVVLAAVYGVPDDQAGDQVMVGIVLREGASFDPEAFAHWLDAQDAIGPKWRPRYLRVLLDPPSTGTNKIVKRTLVHQKWRSDRVGDDAVYVRGRAEDVYRELTADDEQELRDSFVRYQRERFWDL